MIRWRTIAAAATLLVTTPSAGMAHLVNSGLGPFYDGALHLLLSPGDLLGLVAAVLLAGASGAKACKPVVLILPVVWFMAGIVGLNLPSPIELPWLSVLSFLILGILVAIDPKLPPIMIAFITALFGLLHGLLNGSALRIIGAGPMSLFGIAAIVLIVSLLLSAAIVSLRAAWARMTLRVAGSWIAAIGMLMLGWLVRSTG